LEIYGSAFYHEGVVAWTLIGQLHYVIAACTFLTTSHSPSYNYHHSALNIKHSQPRDEKKLHSKPTKDKNGQGDDSNDISCPVKA
jgi:hypothetical protein